MVGCIFCKIVQKQIPAKIAYEDDYVLAFEDVDPQAPVHFLVIPKEHIGTVLEVDEKHKDILCKMYEAAAKLAVEKKIDSRGFRLVINTNSEAGQTVFHLHMHLLGGRHMAWPPG
ncbi:MAG: histidine triad nucleotide-binding protein [Candidatus Firestonebacteria bacterium]